jgi:hypothetical protein
MFVLNFPLLFGVVLLIFVLFYVRIDALCFKSEFFAAVSLLQPHVLKCRLKKYDWVLKVEKRSDDISNNNLCYEKSLHLKN